jgi:hypothetical protein
VNQKLAQLLTRLYPSVWRERYGAEFAEFLQDSESGLRASANVVGAAIHEHVFPTLRSNMQHQFSSFQGWCVRAPWAVFILTPVVLLSVAYLAACSYLWLGWQIFLPGADTPFGHRSGPIYGVQNIYFQIGKFFYFGAPILVSWATVAIAVRQGVKATRLIIGWVLVAWVSNSAQIHASRTLVHRGFGHVSMGFPLGSTLHAIYRNPSYALAIFLLSALPYLLRAFTNRRSSAGRA